MAVTHRATRRIRLLAMLALLAMPTTATGVEDTGGGEAPRGISADYRASTRHCPRPGDPRRIPMDCRLSRFDVGLQAFTEFWADARDEMQLVGVTPRASLYASPYGNAGGPVPDPVRGGTLFLSLALDMGKPAGGPRRAVPPRGAEAGGEHLLQVNYSRAGASHPWKTLVRMGTRT